MPVIIAIGLATMLALVSAARISGSIRWAPSRSRFHWWHLAVMIIPLAAQAVYLCVRYAGSGLENVLPPLAVNALVMIPGIVVYVIAWVSAVSHVDDPYPVRCLLTIVTASIALALLALDLNEISQIGALAAGIMAALLLWAAPASVYWISDDSVLEKPVSSS